MISESMQAAGDFEARPGAKHNHTDEKRAADFAARADGKFHLGLPSSQIAYYEVLYLEFLRGQPGAQFSVEIKSSGQLHSLIDEC